MQDLIKSIRSLFCDSGFQEFNDVVRIWYEWKVRGRERTYSIWRYQIIYLTMYLAQLIQTVIFPTENFIEPDWMNPLSKILQIPNFKIFASNNFSTFQVIFNQNSETPKVYNLTITSNTINIIIRQFLAYKNLIVVKFLCFWVQKSGYSAH